MKNHSKTFRQLRGGLLGAASVSSLMIGSAMADPGYEGACTLVGTTVTCEGANAAGGVNIGDLGISQLNVSLLTADIVPPAGSPGVVLDTTSAAAVDIDNTGYTIRTSGSGADGIYVSSWANEGVGGGNASLVLLGSVESTGARGVVVTGFGSATSNTTGDISSLGQALTVKGEGGPVTVDHTGKLTSLEGGGLSVEAMGGSDIEVHGDIDSLGTAVESHSYDNGATSVVIVGKVTSREGSGIVVREDSGTTTVDVTGDIAAHVDGIKVNAYGDVDIDQKGKLTTDSGVGIYGNSSTGSVDITRNGAALNAHGDAIVADAHGMGGHVTIASPGAVNSDAGRGVVATTSDGTVDITLGSTTTAKLDAIVAVANGGGSTGVDIDSNGAVTSYDARGIYAESTGTGITADGKTFGIRIDQTGDVTAKTNAVTAKAANSNIYVNIDGSVVSYDGKGVSVSADNGLISLFVENDVTSKLDAIDLAAANGDVGLDVRNVESYSGKGIDAASENGAVDLVVGGYLTAKLDAIDAYTANGTIDIGVDGDITSYSGEGIDANSDNGDIDIDLGGKLTSELDAITATTKNGGVGVSVVGDVLSNKGKGIDASSLNGAVTVAVGTSSPDVTSDVTSQLDAITAHTNNGAVKVTVTGDVQSYEGKAISASTDSGIVDIEVDGGASGGEGAITAHSNDSQVTVAVGGDVTSDKGFGASATSGNGSVSVTIDGDVLVALDAIIAQSTGATVGVDIGGSVSSGGNGIYATATGATDIDVTGSVATGLDAIYALADNGAVTITVGAVQSDGGKGVYAQSMEGNVDVTVNGAVTSELDAIFAQASDGAVTVEAGDVTSISGNGIYAQSNNGAVEVSVGSVGSKLDAIYALADNGDVTVTTTGGVSSTDGRAVYVASANGAVKADIGGDVDAGGKGIEARADNGNVDVLVAGKVGASGDAIYAVTKNGTVTVDIDGNVDSYNGTGIYAQSPSGAVTIDAGAVTSKLDAIYAQSNSGSVDINAASVISYSGKGVYAQSNASSVDVATGDITSEFDALYAQSNAGKVTVSTGDVLSNKGKGIYAQSNGGAVEVDLGSLTSELDGIYAQSNAASVSVEAGGGVTSYKGSAIQALSGSGTVTINVDGNVLAGDKGIYAVTHSGSIDVDVGGNVTAKNDAIHTEADSGSINIDADTILSYDGQGIYAVADSGTVTINAGDVTSKLAGIYAESRDSAVAVDLTGGVTSYSGVGIHALTANGNVTVDVDGKIISQGDAIVTGSTGGANSSAIKITTGDDITSYTGRGIVAGSALGTVTIDNAGTLTAELGGIVAQSTGEGLTGAVKVTQTGSLLSWKGKGIDASSAGGPVTIVTKVGVSADLDAIVAQSFNGPNVGIVSVSNSGGDIVSYKGTGIIASAASDGVTVDNTGAIVADTGGIWAQSLGTTGTSIVTVTQTGNVTVAKGSGIFAKSSQGTGVTLDGNITGGTYGINATSLAGAVTVSVAQGNVISGSSDAGVYLDAATTALLTNRGDISSDGLSVSFGGTGTGTVDNYGTISGDFAFNGGAGTFNNYLGATYNADTAMTFANGGTFYNSGTLSLTGGTPQSAIQTTTLTGNLSQSSTGKLYTDVHLGDDTADRLAVSGTASLAGALTLNLTGDIDAGLLGSFNFVSAAGGVTFDGLSISNPTLHGVITADNGIDGIVRIAGIDFNPTGITTAVVPTSTYVQSVFEAGVPEELKPLLLALANTEDMPAYEAALSQLSPDEYSQEIQNSYGYNLSFSNRLLSCRVADGPNRFKAEGDCDWFGVRGSVLEQDATDQQTAFEQTFATLEAGSQRRIDDTWRLGGAIALTNAVTSAADGSETKATQGQAGVVVKYDIDALLLASTLTAGYGIHDNERHVAIGNFDDTLTGEAALAYLSTRIHAAYTVDLGATYIKPLFNLDLTATHFGGVTETGGGAALTVDAGTQYAATFNPAIEVGGELVDTNGNLIRPYVQVGLEGSLTSDLQLAARFSGVDPSLGTFTIGQPGNEPVAKVSIGADILTQDSTTIRLYYDGAFGATSRKNGLGMKLSSTFE